MTKPLTNRQQADSRHLARVGELVGQVAAAISAIESNDLSKLKSAIAGQERICNELAATKWVPCTAGKASSSASECDRQIYAAYIQLAQANRVYSGVVKRSQRMVDLLSMLYKGRTDGVGTSGTAGEGFQTLSCEA